jgi:hypothetical protein
MTKKSNAVELVSGKKCQTPGTLMLFGVDIAQAPNDLK